MLLEVVFTQRDQGAGRNTLTPTIPHTAASQEGTLGSVNQTTILMLLRTSGRKVALLKEEAIHLCSQ